MVERCLKQMYIETSQAKPLELARYWSMVLKELFSITRTPKENHTLLRMVLGIGDAEFYDLFGIDTWNILSSNNVESWKTLRQMCGQLCPENGGEIDQSPQEENRIGEVRSESEYKNQLHHIIDYNKQLAVAIDVPYCSEEEGAVYEARKLLLTEVKRRIFDETAAIREYNERLAGALDSMTCTIDATKTVHEARNSLLNEVSMKARGCTELARKEKTLMDAMHAAHALMAGAGISMSYDSYPSLINQMSSMIVTKKVQPTAAGELADYVPRHLYDEQVKKYDDHMTKCEEARRIITSVIPSDFKSSFTDWRDRVADHFTTALNRYQDQKAYNDNASAKILGAIGKIEQPVNLTMDPFDKAVEIFTSHEEDRKLFKRTQMSLEECRRQRELAEAFKRDTLGTLTKTGYDRNHSMREATDHCITHWNVLRRAIAAIGASGEEFRPNPITAADCMEIINDVQQKQDDAMDKAKFFEKSMYQAKKSADNWFVACMFTLIALIVTAVMMSLMK